MPPSPTLHHTRRLIEHRYGLSLSQLRDDTTHTGTTDQLLRTLLRRYAELEATERSLRETRERLRQLVDDDTGPAEPFATAAHQAQRLHALAVRREQQTTAIWDLLTIHDHQPNPAGPPALHAVPAPDIDDLLPLARHLTNVCGHLSRDTLGTGLRAHGVTVSNQRLSALLRHLRTEQAGRVA